MQDVRASAGSAHWHRVFLADLSDPNDPKITTRRACHSRQRRRQYPAHALARRNTAHDLLTNDPNQYTVSTFAESDVPLDIGTQEGVRIGHADKPILAMGNRELYRRSQQPCTASCTPLN